ncbi:hypothetical protein TNCV_1525261 [Trichonephila clavipes]|nr:hypothetical protein TNCV_1525261 [Trichonephila clavipes]
MIIKPGQNVRPRLTMAKDYHDLSSIVRVAEWYRYRIVACLITSSSPVPLKTRRVGQRCTLNDLSLVWCDSWEREGATSGVVKVTGSWLHCHELEPSTGEDPPCRKGQCTLNTSWIKRLPIDLVLKLGEEEPNQVSSSSLEKGSRLSGPSSREVK